MGGAAAAIGGGGLIGGIYAGNKAASAQRAAANEAKNRIESGKNEAIGYLNPYSDFGRSAMSPLSALLTGQKYDVDTGEFTKIGEDERMASFLQSPGYKFRLGQGLSAIEKSAAARGQSLSGGKYKALNEQAQGIASDEYNNYVQSLFQQLGVGQQADSAKANTAMGAASGVANYAYQGGMANANKYANLSNFGFGMAGMGAYGGMGGFNQSQTPPLGGGGGGSGRYNSSYGIPTTGGPTL
jgi:hypothetical protein